MRARAAVAAFVLAVSLPSTALAAGADPGGATPLQREQAQARFLRGRVFFAQKKYDEALVEFRGSLDIVASPNTRLSVARTLRELGKLMEAYVEFGRTAVEAKELSTSDTRYAKAGEAAAVERASLEPKLGFVTVRVAHAEEESVLKIGGETVRRGAWGEPAPLTPGSSDVVVESPGRKPVSKNVTVAAGQKISIALDVADGAKLVSEPGKPDETSEAPKQPTPTKSNNLRPFAYVAGGIGAAGLLTFTIAGLMANGTHSQLQTDCGKGPCPASKSDDISSGRTQQTIANIGLVVGLVGVAAGVTLFVLSKPSTSPGAPSAAIVILPGGLGVRGAL